MNIYNISLFVVNLQGGKYWRFENDALDPGFPKVVKTGFDGLQGHITAALSVPQYLSRKESVYFFKRGNENILKHFNIFLCNFFQKCFCLVYRGNSSEIFIPVWHQSQMRKNGPRACLYRSRSTGPSSRYGTN